MTTKPKVLISDKMDENAARIFRERGCDVDVITGEVLATGRRELLPFVREQAVSTTRHRFGHVAG